MKKVKLIIILSAIIVLVIFPAINQIVNQKYRSTNEQSLQNNPVMDVFKITTILSSISEITEYLEQDPILILNNSAFGPSGYNFPGYGNNTHPFRIENYNISSSLNHLIEIRNTDVFFEINNNTLNGINWNFKGIIFSNVTHGKIHGNVINNGMQGISLDSNATNNLISGNSVNFHNEGIELSNSDTNVISNNTFYHNIDGIYLWNSDYNSIHENSVTENYDGIKLITSSNNEITGNHIHDNEGDSIRLDGADNNMIEYNTIYNSKNGIFLSSTSNSILSGNNVRNNTDIGIYLEYSKDNILSGNIVNSNGYGIWLISSSNNEITWNTANSNAHGIWLDFSSKFNIVHRNIVRFNNGYGFYLVMVANNNSIYFNDIYDNLNSQSYEESDCKDNQWDNGVIGNYWGSDYSNNYPNATNDGKIWDIPYAINGTANGIDYFPLVNSITLDIDKPQFIVIPDDFSINEDYSNLSVSWIAIDEFPSKYTIQLNGIEVIREAVWINGTAISFNIPTGLQTGNHNVTITLTDENGYTMYNTMIITVIMNKTTTKSTKTTRRSIPTLTSGFELFPLFLGLLVILGIKKSTRRTKSAINN